MYWTYDKYIGIGKHEELCVNDVLLSNFKSTSIVSHTDVLNIYSK